MKLDNARATIIFDLPERVDAEEVASFIADALESWGGQRHPDDGLFNSLSIKSVTIGNVKYENPKPKKF